MGESYSMYIHYVHVLLKHIFVLCQLQMFSVVTYYIVTTCSRFDFRVRIARATCGNMGSYTYIIHSRSLVVSRGGGGEMCIQLFSLSLSLHVVQNTL